MRGIYINYRQEDAEGQAGRLFDDLSAHFGPDGVFMPRGRTTSFPGIKKGLDFRRSIEEYVTSCGVLLVMIGKWWLSATDSTGKRRLDNPNDFVRLEIAAALSRDIPVVPVLVHDAVMPTERELPDALKELAFRNGTELTHARWDLDVKLLIEDLRPYVDAPADARPTRDPSSVASARKAVDAAVLCDSSGSGKLEVGTTEVPAGRSRIFISYRHEVDEYAVGRLAEELRQHFPRDQVFEDIASIDPGADFVDALQHGLDTCAAVLVVIGPNWVTATDRQGRRRLDLPDDWVRYEVAESLRNPGVRVFPLLLDAEMPSADDLPESLRPLTRRQAFPLTGRHWANDTAKLIEFLKKVPGLATSPA